MLIGPILWGHSGLLCHALSSLLLLLLLWTSILHCHSPGVATVARRLHYSYSWLRLILVVVSTVLAVANGPNIFQMLLVNHNCINDKRLKKMGQTAGNTETPYRCFTLTAMCGHSQCRPNSVHAVTLGQIVPTSIRIWSGRTSESSNRTGYTADGRETKGPSSGQDSARWPFLSSTINPGIVPSDDPGEALSVSSKDIHLSKHAKVSGIHCTLWPQCTNVTDRRTDRRTLTA